MEHDVHKTYENGRRDALIEDLITDLQEIKTDVKSLLQESAAMKVKAGLISLIGGAIPAVVLFIYMAVRGAL